MDTINPVVDVIDPRNEEQGAGRKEQANKGALSSSSLSPLPFDLAPRSHLALSTRQPLPAPRVDINIRPATLDDIPFIDSLQKANNKQLGFLNKPTLEGKVGLGHVLVAEVRGEGRGTRDENGAVARLSLDPRPSTLLLVTSSATTATSTATSWGSSFSCAWCRTIGEAWWRLHS